MAAPTRIVAASLALVVVTIAAVVYLRLAPAGEISEIRDRLVAMEKKVQELAQASPMAERTWHTQRVAPVPGPASQKASAPAEPLENGADRSAFDEILGRAGMTPDSVESDQLQHAAASVNEVTGRLFATFNTSTLAEHAFVRHAGCEGSSCALDVTFATVSSAIEHEMQLTQWLSQADGRCGFTLAPLAIDAIDANENISRRVAMDCG